MKKKLISFLTLLLALAPFVAAIGLYSKSVEAQRLQVGLNQPLFLIGGPKITFMKDPVILVAPYGEGHVGVALNQPTGQTMSSLFPEHAPSQAVEGPVYLGGPVSTGMILMLAKFEAPPETPRAIEMLPGIWLVYDGLLIDHIIETRPNEARYFRGYAGWKAGELERRLKDPGYFTARPAEPEKVFSDPSKLYEQLAPAARGKGLAT
jgi:putative transcriptional regulator